MIDKGKRCLFWLVIPEVSAMVTYSLVSRPVRERASRVEHTQNEAALVWCQGTGEKGKDWDPTLSAVRRWPKFFPSLPLISTAANCWLECWLLPGFQNLSLWRIFKTQTTAILNKIFRIIPADSLSEFGEKFWNSDSEKCAKLYKMGAKWHKMKHLHFTAHIFKHIWVQITENWAIGAEFCERFQEHYMAL